MEKYQFVIVNDDGGIILQCSLNGAFGFNVG